MKNIYRVGPITPITTTFPVLRTFYHEVTILNTLETTKGAITTQSWVVPTIHSTCRSPITSLCHTTLRLCRSISYEVLWILILKLTYVPWCKCTSIWWSRSILVVLKRRPVWITLLLPWLPVLAFLFQNSSVSLNLSSSTFCTWIINLAMSISPITITSYPLYLTNGKSQKQTKSSCSSYQPSPTHNKTIVADVNLLLQFLEFVGTIFYFSSTQRSYLFVSFDTQIWRFFCQNNVFPCLLSSDFLYASSVKLMGKSD